MKNNRMFKKLQKAISTLLALAMLLTSAPGITSLAYAKNTHNKGTIDQNITVITGDTYTNTGTINGTVTIQNNANFNNYTLDSKGKTTGAGSVTDLTLNNGTLSSYGSGMSQIINNGTYNLQGGTTAGAISGTNGTITMSGTATIGAKITGQTITANKGILTINKDTTDATDTLNLNAGTLNLQNGTLSATTLNAFNAALGTKLLADAKFSGDTIAFDTIAANSATGSLALGSINIGGTAQSSWADNETKTVQLIDGDNTTITITGTTTATQDGYRYDITQNSTEAGKLDITKHTITIGDNKDLLASIIQARTDSASSYSLEKINTYSLNSADQTLSEELGKFTGANRELTINGNGNKLTANENAGIQICSSSQTLNLTNITLSGFTTFAENAGTINLTDTTFTTSNSTDIQNTGTVNIYGTTGFSQGITGEGKTNITGDADFGVLGKLTQDEINIEQPGTLTILADNLKLNDATSALQNSGTLILSDGTLSTNIAGGGTTQINGNITLSDATKIANKTQILTGAILNANASNLTGDSDIQNAGTFNITAGELTNSITGTGTTNIYTALTLGKTTNISQGKIAIGGADASLTANVNNITITGSEGLQNEATLNLSGNGKIKYAITGTGTTNILQDATIIANKQIANTLNIASGATLNILAGNLANGVTTNGTLTLTGGTLANEIKGEGTTNITGTVTSTGAINTNIISVANGGSLTLADAGLLGGNIQNEGTITLTGGTLAKGITGNGTTEINGSLTLADTATLATATTIAESATLSANISNITLTGTGITNKGTLNITAGSSFASSIYGSGTTNIKGTTLSLGEYKIVQGALNIASGSGLTANVSNLTLTGTGITNNGSLTLTGGTSEKAATLTAAITGTGTTNITGTKETTTTITATQSIKNNIVISEYATLMAYSDLLKEAVTITNSGTLTLLGGTLTKAVTGEGITTIGGNTTLNASVANAITINSGMTLTTATEYIGSTIENNGTLTLTGATEGYAKVEKNITGEGTTNITANTEIASGTTIANKIVISSGVTLNTAAASLAGSETQNYGTININSSGNSVLGSNITGTGNIEIASGATLNATEKSITQNKITVDGTSTTSYGTLYINPTNTTLTSGIALNGGYVVLSSGNNYNSITGTSYYSQGGVLISGTVNNYADMDITDSMTTGSSGALTIQEGAVLNNYGKITVKGASRYFDILNSGTLTSSANDITLAHQLLNDGIYNVLGGTIGYYIYSTDGIMNIQKDTTVNNTIMGQTINVGGTTAATASTLSVNSVRAFASSNKTNTLVINQTGTLDLSSGNSIHLKELKTDTTYIKDQNHTDNIPKLRISLSFDSDGKATTPVIYANSTTTTGGDSGGTLMLQSINLTSATGLDKLPVWSGTVGSTASYYTNLISSSDSSASNFKVIVPDYWAGAGGYYIGRLSAFVHDGSNTTVLYVVPGKVAGKWEQITDGCIGFWKSTGASIESVFNYHLGQGRYIPSISLAANYTQANSLKHEANATTGKIDNKPNDYYFYGNTKSFVAKTTGMTGITLTGKHETLGADTITIYNMGVSGYGTFLDLQNSSNVAHLDGVNFSNISTADVNNNGSLYFTGSASTLYKGITGTGTTYVQTDLTVPTTASLKQAQINVDRGATLTIANMKNVSGTDTNGTGGYIYSDGTVIVQSGNFQDTIHPKTAPARTSRYVDIYGTGTLKIQNNNVQVMSEDNYSLVGIQNIEVGDNVYLSSTPLCWVGGTNQIVTLGNNSTLYVWGDSEDRDFTTNVKGDSGLLRFNQYRGNQKRTYISDQVKITAPIDMNVNTYYGDSQEHLVANVNSLQSTVTNNGQYLYLWGTGNTPTLAGTGYLYVGGVAANTTDATAQKLQNGDLTASGTIPYTTEIRSGSTLTSSVDYIGASVTNNGSLKLTGNDKTLTQTVTGNGTTYIDGSITLSSNAINTAIEISAGNSLNATADKLGGNITNTAGTLNLTGGTLAHTISGAGDTITTNSVIFNNTVENKLTIADESTANISASNLKNAQTINNGTLNLTAGELTSVITGTGTTNITGNGTTKVQAGTGIYTNVSITEGASLETDASNLNKQTTNDGTLTLTGGTLGVSIQDTAGTGTKGTLNINTNMTLASGQTINQSTITLGSDNTLIANAGQITAQTITNEAGTVTLTGGTLNSSVTGAGATNISGTVTVADGKTISNRIQLAQSAELTASGSSLNNNVTNEDGTIKLTGGTLAKNKNIIGNGSTEINGAVTVDDAAKIANAITISATGTLSANANSLTYDGNITNNTNTGILSLTGGTLSHSVLGADGTTDIEGAVTFAAADENKITIGTSGNLTTALKYLENESDITNNGKLRLTNIVASVTNNLRGSGTLYLAENSETTSKVTIENNVNIATGGTFTYSGIGNNTITGKIINNGTLNANANMIAAVENNDTYNVDGGTIKGVITKSTENGTANGNLNIDTDVTIAADVSGQNINVTAGGSLSINGTYLNKDTRNNMKLNSELNLRGVTEDGSGGYKVSTLYLNSFEGEDNANVYIDLWLHKDASGNASATALDQIDANTVKGTLKLNIVNLYGASELGVGQSTNATLFVNEISGLTLTGTHTAQSDKNAFKIEADSTGTGNIKITKVSDNATLEKVVHGDSATYNPAQIGTYNLMEDYNLTEALGTLARVDDDTPRTLTINGNLHAINAGDYKDPLTINEGDSLEVIDTRLNGFKHFANDAGTLTLENSTFTGTTGDYDVKNDGTLIIKGTTTFAKGITGTGSTELMSSLNLGDSGKLEQGKITLDTGTTLTINAANLKITSTEDGAGIQNEGGLLSLTGGSATEATEFAGAITGAGTTETAGYIAFTNSVANDINVKSGVLTIDAKNIQGSEITNAGKLILGDGTLSAKLSGTGVLDIKGEVTIQKSLSNMTLAILENGNLKTSADNLGKAIENNNTNATLTLTGGTLAQNITGANGTTAIAGSVTANADIYNKIKIQVGTLATDLSRLKNTTADIENAATLNITGGTLAQNITGEGTTQVSANLDITGTGKTITQKQITISGINKLTANASSLSANSSYGINNEFGTLILKGDATSGKLANTSITGKQGTTQIAGTITTEKEIQNTLQITSGASLNSAVENITGTNAIQNAGSLILTGEGTLGAKVAAYNNTTGTVKIASGSVTIDKETNASAEVASGATLTLAETSSASVLQNITNSGTLNIASYTAEGKTITNNTGGVINLNAIYAGSTIANAGTINTEADGTLSQNITGTNGKLNINSNITVSGTVTGQDINVSTGKTLTLAKGASLNTDTTDNLTLNSGATLSLANGAIETTTLGTVTSNNGILNFDVNYDGTTLKSDLISATATNDLNLGAVAFLGDGYTSWEKGDTKTVQLVTGATSLNISSTTVSQGESVYEIKESSSKGKGWIDITFKSGNMTLYNIIQNKEGAGSVSAYTLADDMTLTDGLGELTRVDKDTPRSFILSGQNKTMTANSHGGITVNSGDTLTVQNITLSGFETFAKNAGTLNLDSVTFSDGKTADIENSGTLNINGAVTLNQGITGTGTTNINYTTALGSISVAQANLTIAKDVEVTAQADKLNITNGISNAAGTLYLTGTDATLNSSITGGSGKTYIRGTITAEKEIANSVKIENSTYSLTTNTANLQGDTESAGSITLTGEGTLSHNITGYTGATGTTTNGTVQIAQSRGTGTTLEAENSITAQSFTVGTGGIFINNGTINADSLTNSGQFTQQGAKLAMNITNNEGATFTTAGDLITNIANAGTVVITGGKLTAKITGTSGTTKITGEVTNSNKDIENILEIAEGGKFTTNAGYITESETGITNNGTLTLNDGSLLRSVSGTGTLAFNGVQQDMSETARTITQNKVTLDSSSALTLNAGSYKVAETETGGRLIFKSGQIAGSYSGSGNIIINGTITTAADTDIKTASLTINEPNSLTNKGKISAAVTNLGTLTTAADTITGGVVNGGKLILTGGALASDITATTTDGTLEIAGAVTNTDNKTIQQNALTIDATGNFSTNADKLTSDIATITNNGTLTLTGGTLDSDIVGDGTTAFTTDTTTVNVAVKNTSVATDGGLTIAAANLTGTSNEVNGTLTLNEGDLAAASIISGTGKVITGGNINASASNFKNTGGVINDYILTLTGGTIGTNILNTDDTNPGTTKMSANDITIAEGVTVNNTIEYTGSASTKVELNDNATIGGTIKAANGEIVISGTGVKNSAAQDLSVLIKENKDLTTSGALNGTVTLEQAAKLTAVENGGKINGNITVGENATVTATPENLTSEIINGSKNSVDFVEGNYTSTGKSTFTGTIKNNGENIGWTKVLSGALINKGTIENDIVLYGGTQFNNSGTLRDSSTMYFRALDSNADKRTITVAGDLSKVSTMYFNLEGLSSGSTIVKATNTIDMSGKTVELIKKTRPTMGDTITLIENASGYVGKTVKAHELTDEGQIGVTTQYKYKTYQSGNSLFADYLSGSATPEAKSFSEGRLIGAAAITGSSDLLAGNAMESAFNAAQTSAGEAAAFAEISGAHGRYHTGSYVDLNSTQVVAGLAGKINDKATIGAYVEGGNGRYTAYNQFDTGEIQANGDINYFGAGLFGKYDINKTKKGTAYINAAIGAGHTAQDYSTEAAQIAGRYDSSTGYTKAHATLGYAWNIQGGKVDSYIKYLYAHQNGDSVKLTTGDQIDFEAIDSHRLRAGVRYSQKINNNSNWYFGGAYEYEFDMAAKATTEGFPIAEPDLKGASAMAELGYNYTPKKSDGWKFNIGVQGFTGKRDSIGVNLGATYEFPQTVVKKEITTVQKPSGITAEQASDARQKAMLKGLGIKDIKKALEAKKNAAKAKTKPVAKYKAKLMNITAEQAANARRNAMLGELGVKSTKKAEPEKKTAPKVAPKAAPKPVALTAEEAASARRNAMLGELGVKSTKKAEPEKKTAPKVAPKATTKPVALTAEEAASARQKAMYNELGLQDIKKAEEAKKAAAKKEAPKTAPKPVQQPVAKPTQPVTKPVKQKEMSPEEAANARRDAMMKQLMGR